MKTSELVARRNAKRNKRASTSAEYVDGVLTKSQQRKYKVVTRGDYNKLKRKVASLKRQIADMENTIDELDDLAD